VADASDLAGGALAGAPSLAFRTTISRISARVADRDDERSACATDASTPSTSMKARRSRTRMTGDPTTRQVPMRR
jgi:hypothetical protein